LWSQRIFRYRSAKIKFKKVKLFLKIFIDRQTDSQTNVVKYKVVCCAALLNKAKTRENVYSSNVVYSQESDKNVSPKLAHFIVNKERERKWWRRIMYLFRTSRHSAVCARLERRDGANTLLTYISKNLSFKIVHRRRSIIPLNVVRCQQSLPYVAPRCLGAYRMRRKLLHACGQLRNTVSVSNVIYALYAAVYRKDVLSRYTRLVCWTPIERCCSTMSKLIFHYWVFIWWTILVNVITS
jgi:hypothetical protein